MIYFDIKLRQILCQQSR